MEQLSSTYTYAMVKADGQRAERSLIKYRHRIARAHLMNLLSRLVLPNSGVSFLLAVSIAALVAQPIYA